MKTENNGQQKLVPPGELIDFQPEWFKAALAQTPQDRLIDFNGSKAHYRLWQGPRADAEALVLMHGDGAHARWFDFIAPLLTPYYHVMAADLPGMGDGGWLADYSRDIMADAIIAMVRDANFTGKPAIIAHSFGGLIGMIAAHHYADEIAALMICDFHVKPPHAHEEWFEKITEPRKLRVYATREAAEARFRLAPDQPCENQYILDYVAEHSVREMTADVSDGLRAMPRETGFTWKFDPAIYVNFRLGDDLPEIYKTLPIPLAAMFGALAHDFDTVSRLDLIAHMRALRPDAPHFDIAGAHHHIMLDRPHAFTSTILAMMANWRAGGVFSTS